ncbi:hydroxymethylbilane synthase [Sugiyamaella lignohabitans]|uniref:Porphobilinogen deaminase n=1 Tax=Sugiyamaella lignohabitans TaxID=796027 RepID=A0A167D4U7_9ASCO|nr:hydroxymethylbilane synthase [Sugiyamaella lignohabitans]ANB12480.1 hydroxymethylbilane synthase [Sugiyamaella lignohabitans]
MSSTTTVVEVKSPQPQRASLAGTAATANVTAATETTSITNTSEAPIPPLTPEIHAPPPYAPTPAPTEEDLRVDRYDTNEGEPGGRIYVGGRKSKLAVVQSRYVASCLKNVHPGLNFPVIALTTLGDRVKDRPLYAFGGKSLWTKELEIILLNKLEGIEQIDMIVHSLKDMPTSLPDHCILGAITQREDPRDALVMPLNSPYKHLKDLPDGSIVGTSSIRRSAQLKRRYPKLKFESVRGAVPTRLSKLDDPEGIYSCIILAAAGMIRLGLEKRITSFLEAPDMYYAVGQGALGVEIRAGDDKIKRLVSRINHRPTSMCCLAERSLMKTLEGGCSVPIGVESNFESKTSLLEITGIVVSVDGTECVQGTVSAIANTDEEAEQVGRDLAADLLAKGAKKILDAIQLDHIE